MKKFKSLLIGSLLVGFVACLSPVVPSAQAAVDPLGSACKGQASQSEVCKGKSDQVNSTVGNIVSALFWIVGIIAVVVLIIAGIMYMTSAGDPGKAAKAKNAVLYAIIGLIVAIMSGAIVTWVVQKM